MRFYTNPKDESDKWKLPDAEVFYMSEEDISKADDGEWYTGGEGWYVWTCLPGCLPDSDPWGPYKSEEEAVKDWRDNFGDEWEDAE